MRQEIVCFSCLYCPLVLQRCPPLSMHIMQAKGGGKNRCPRKGGGVKRWWWWEGGEIYSSNCMMLNSTQVIGRISRKCKFTC